MIFRYKKLEVFSSNLITFVLAKWVRCGFSHQNGNKSRPTNWCNDGNST